jgi:ankyrin repeat protein
MTELQEEPAIFQLIRNRDVSIDAIRLYLKHYPKRLQYPVHGDDTILSVAVKECFALDSPEVFENGDVNALLIRQLSILSVVADFVDVCEITTGQSIFHLLLQFPYGSNNGVEEVGNLEINMYKLISNTILDVLLKHVTVADETSILFLRNEEFQLALHVAIFHDNHKAARKLLSRMRNANCEYSHYEYIEPDRKIPLLHYLLMHSPSSKVLPLIFTIFPHAASTPDIDGILPLAVALENSLSLRKIDLIINMHPLALSTTNGDGDLPLHLAAMDCPHQVDILELLIDRYEAALLIENHNGQLPLHCCLEYQNNCHQDESINLTTVKILSSYNRASNNVGIGESDEEISGGKMNDDTTTNASVNSSPGSSGRSTVPYFDYELNGGMSSEMSPNLCECLVLEHRDSYGEIPLHIACRGLTSCSCEIISWLIECYPESASSTNKFGHLPMHLLAASEVHNAEDGVIEQCFDLLFNAYPCALYTRDNEGDIPLQCLLTHCNILPKLMNCMITKMTRINETNLHLMENPYTRHLPLHTACLSGIYEVDVLNQLISVYPEALLYFDVDGLLPFHIALESPKNCNDSILKTLLYRPADKTQNMSWQSTTLPCTADGIPALFFACQNVKVVEDDENEDDTKRSDCKALDTIRFLVENSPELFINK